MSDTGPTTPVWRKSTRSGGVSGQCVEVAAFSGAVSVRDSKNPHLPALSVTPRVFSRLLDGIKIP